VPHPLNDWIEKQTPKPTNKAFAGQVGCTEGRIRQIRSGWSVGKRLAQRISLVTGIPVVVLLYPPTE